MLAYDDHGDGDPIVFLHGLAASREIWHRARGRLAGRRVIAVDLPGFGDSPGVGRGFALEEVARAVLDGIPADAGRITLVGHSMGGAVALTAASLEPERLGALVLCASAGLLAAPLPGWATRPAGAAWDASVHLRGRLEPLAGSPVGRRILLGLSTAPGDALSEADVRGVIRASTKATRTGAALRAVARADLREVLASVDVPVGFVWGTGDMVVPRRSLDAGLAARPDAEVELISGAGHLPMLERPAEFTAALERLDARLRR
jgi:pimeloyl-ACP methyl ester carboxylesterase